MTINNSIISGTIAIEDGTKAKEEFAPARKVKVELSFSVPEGQDGSAYMHGVARIAEAKVASMLGRTAPAETPAAPAAPAATAAAPVKPETAAAKKKREAAEAAEAAANAPQKTKADLAKEAGLPATSTTHKGPAADEELLDDEPNITAAGVVVPEEDELNDLLGEAAPAPITDVELGKAAQEKNAKAKAEFGEKWAPAKIRDLIAEFAGAGKRINDIPAAKRADFLKKLDALK